MILKWLRSKPKLDTDVDAAKKALKESQGRRGEVDEMVTELRERRLKNQFAPALAQALGVQNRRI